MKSKDYLLGQENLKITPVLLAGGSGTRLWPLSRKSFPKQFMPLFDENTLFQNTALRFLSSKVIQFARTIIITNSDYRFVAKQQLNDKLIDAAQILIEPEPKNTAAAILAASITAYEADPSSMLLVVPTDHLIGDVAAFHNNVLAGLTYAQDRKIVCFGVQPSYPETGYGYLEISPERFYETGASKVFQFIEKPNQNNASQMIDEGNFLWNSGIYLFRSEEIIKRFSIYAPTTLELVKSSILNAVRDLDFVGLDKQLWAQLEHISIDYAIMEKIKDLVAVPLESPWSDLGDWQAVWQHGNRDEAGNVALGSAHVVNCKDSLIMAKDDNQHIVGSGLKDIVAISTRDAVLVADRNSAQSVKHVVELLKQCEISSAESSPVDHRPWGWFESLALGDQFQVKRIVVKPGAALSLQSHQHRSEHWIVIKGRAAITIGSERQSLEVGQSVYVPKGVLHRLENVEEDPMELIEVQIGSYLGEDDIVRYEDIYARGSTAKNVF